VSFSITFAVGAPALPDQIIYVDAGAKGANDGSSWVNAFKYLQDALAHAGPGREIWVAQGTYRPDQGNGLTAGDRDASFHLLNGATLKGGFAGSSAPTPNLRDTCAYETILSGDLDDNDQDVADPNALLDDPMRSDNSYSVVTTSTYNGTAFLQGFTISGGHASGGRTTGGGIMVYGWSDLTICDCILRGNSAVRAGGGMHVERTDVVTIENCVFSENYAAGDSTFRDGGGLYVVESRVDLAGSEFIGNVGKNNGGVYLATDGPATIINCLFRENTASEGIGGIELWGLALFELRKCGFFRNQGGDCGGAYSRNPFYEGLSIYARCIFVENTTIDNELARAGGLVAYDAAVINCVFDGNIGYENGNGGMRAFDTQLINCSFRENTSDRDGGALAARGCTIVNCLFQENQSLWTRGGAIASNGSNIVNCTVVENYARLGAGGVYCYGVYDQGDAPSQLCNSIVWGNRHWELSDEEQVIDQATALSVRNSCIEAWSGPYGPPNNNIGANPLFAADGGFRLTAGSPCIDTADSTYVPSDTYDLDEDGDRLEPIPVDLDGNARRSFTPALRDGVIVLVPQLDMGAYEFTPKGG
jgi:predicted outer membrane repeat protein